MKENELIAGKWYEIYTVYGSERYFFKVKTNGSGKMCTYFCKTVFGIDGNLSWSNSSFLGKEYRELSEKECEWAEICNEDKIYLSYEEWFPPEPKMSLLF